MTPELLTAVGINPAFSLLPPVMDSPEARAMLFAIALQESKMTARRQGDDGPARSYWQFEKGGLIQGVLSHRASSMYASNLCVSLDISPTANAVYKAIEYHDVLASGFARLGLWTLPRRLPKRSEVDNAWQQYIDAWRPGIPHHDTWAPNYAAAWDCVSP